MTVATRHLTLGKHQYIAPSWQRGDPDVELRIWLENDPSAAAGKSLRFEVTAPALELQRRPYGPHPLASDPQKYFERFYDKIAASDGQEALAALCAELTELLPPELHEILWEQRDKGWALWLLSEEESWIPWEILKLRGQNETGRWVPGPYLCEVFRVTRWPAGIYCQDRLPVRRLAGVLGRFSELEELSEERRLLEELRQGERTVEILPPARREVLAAMDSASFDVWHFASHGEWHDHDPTGAEILLDSEESIKLRDVLSEAPNFCSNHPLIILNACHLGRGGRGLASWSGWTARLVQMEAGAVLGALWPIADGAAVRFVRSFYREFFSGAPLAEAVLQARLETREDFPDEATWLAFTAHGHPLAVCVEPEPLKALTPGPSPASGRGEQSEELLKIEQPAVHPSPTGGRGAGGEDPLRAKERPRSRRLRWAAGGLVLSLLIFGVLTGVRTDTRITLDLTVKRLAFTAGGEKTAPLTDSRLPLESVMVARFARLEMHPLELSRLDVQGEWALVKGLEEKVALVAADPASQISIEADGSEPLPVGLMLDRWWIEPGSQVLVRATDHGEGIELGLEVAPSGSLALSVAGSWALAADAVAFRGFGSEPGDRTAPQAFLKGRLRNDRSFVEVFPGQESLAISGTVGPFAADEPLLSRDLPISSLDLLTQDVDGEWRSTLVAPGKLSYPDRDQPVVLAAGDFLAVEGLRDFRLRQIHLDPRDGPLRISLEGIARKIRSGPKDHARDHRLSLYQQWFGDHLVQSLAAWITGWMALSLTLAELWQHLAKRE